MSNHFLNMIQDIRRNEVVTLHARILEVTEQESVDTARFLECEYVHESKDYPYVSPAFDRDAALWGAMTLYVSAQLLLYREHSEDDLGKLLPDYPGEITAPAILSADLCLRFIPDILLQLKLIDVEDGLIPVLEKLLHTWHYSGIRYLDEFPDLCWKPICSDPCLEQLYVNRVIENNKTALALHPALKEAVAASLGDHANELWPGFVKRDIS